jgi:hypothetical protein
MCSAGEKKADLATELREHWARIGHGFGVINYPWAGLAAPKVTSDKALRQTATHDHGGRMTSFAVLVICLFE